VNTLFRIPFEDTHYIEDEPQMGSGTVALQLGTSLLALWWSALIMAASAMNPLPRHARREFPAPESAQRSAGLRYREAA
jgi:hypothetical protein